MTGDDAHVGDEPERPQNVEPLPLATRLRHGLVGTALVSVAYLGGLSLFLAGSPIWAAATVVLGSVAFWRWRKEMKRRFDKPELPPVPEARLLGDGRPEKQKPPSGGL